MGETERRRSGLSRRVVSLAGLKVPPMSRFMRLTRRRFFSDPMTAISHVAAADGDVHQKELRLLEMIRHQVEIDRLTGVAIGRAARARFATA